MRATGKLAAVGLLGWALPLAGQQNWDAIEVRVVPVANGVAMLVGSGGNIGVSYGGDGVFLVDDQYAPLTEKIRAAVATVSPRPIRFVLNTHYHGDHTGGNEPMGQAGALIVAHENVRTRMSTEQFNRLMQRRSPPSPPGALPVVTFTEVVTFHSTATRFTPSTFRPPTPTATRSSISAGPTSCTWVIRSSTGGIPSSISTAAAR